MSSDRFGRRIDYLRISVTDRCNLRCTYCMPADGVALRRHSDMLTYEQIVRIARIAMQEGVSKLRVTGGEPLVRRGVADLIRELVDIAGPDAVALTTNGTLLRRHAEDLATAGLARVNISLDSLDPERYARITRGGELTQALDGLHAALETGLAPVKVNAVATSGVADEIGAFLELAAENPVHVRFIERMPIGGTCNAAEDEIALSAAEVEELVSATAQSLGLGPLMPATGAEKPAGWGPAHYYRLAGMRGSIGVIAPISRHFCATCNRLRLTADGTLRPCLFSDHEVSLGQALADPNDEVLRTAIRTAVGIRPPGHGTETVGNPARRRSMHQIGG
jgi:cyclic pyranopterin phosphate synthase